MVGQLTTAEARAIDFLSKKKKKKREKFTDSVEVLEKRK
jgi:hypothetical protein